MKAKPTKAPPKKNTQKSAVVAAKKAAIPAKKSIKKSVETSELSARLAGMSVASEPAVPENARKKSLNWLMIAWLVVLAVALYYFRGQFVVALVNGQPIFRSSLVRELERQSGKQVLDTLVLKTAIMQEAAKNKVAVSPTEVEEEVKKLEETFSNRGQSLDSALAVQGMTRADLQEQMMLQKLVEKMVDQTVEVTDQEVTEYITANKAYLPKDAKPEELKTEVKTQIEQQKKTAKIQEWVTKLKETTKVTNWLFQE